MGYWIDCTCGSEIEVSAGQAGCQVTCKCGKVLNVPSLSELRAQSGERAASPELVVATLYGSGERTVGSGYCALCDSETTNRLTCWIECEKDWAQREHGVGFWLPMLLFMILFPLGIFLYWRPGARKRVFQGRAHGVVVSVCADCLNCALDEQAIKTALRRDPNVARLLHKYPSARVLYRLPARS